MMEQRTRLKKKYSELVRAGHLVAARQVLRLLCNSQLFISDGNDAAWKSGLADWLMTNFRYGNRKWGVTVYAKR